MLHATVAHRCPCGCGREVVTPLSPTDWRLTFDGRAISLEPSVGNWSFPCRSHYFIRSGHVRWAGDMRESDIEFGRARDRSAKEQYYSSGPSLSATSAAWHESAAPDDHIERPTLWARVMSLFDGSRFRRPR